jgi:hypothetical protein
VVAETVAFSRSACQQTLRHDTIVGLDAEESVHLWPID